MIKQIVYYNDYKGIVIQCSMFRVAKNETILKSELQLPSLSSLGLFKEDLGLKENESSLKTKVYSERYFKFEDIKHIKKLANNLPVVIKGVMCKEDALLAIQNGADAIWISNSGGKTLDTVPSSISALKSIAKLVKN